jgi:hypothetical protein
MRHTVICGLSGSTVFFHFYLINAMNFGKKKLLEHKTNFGFFLQLLSETFPILGIKRDVIINSVDVHVKYPLFLPDFNTTLIFSTDLR